VFFADEHLYPTKWQNMIGDKDVGPRINIVEVVTWNDYGESHYIGPIKGTLPKGSEAWVNGFDHTVRELTHSERNRRLIPLDSHS
jgi:glucan endo-1,3-alpha-glucosidase